MGNTQTRHENRKTSRRSKIFSRRKQKTEENIDEESNGSDLVTTAATQEQQQHRHQGLQVGAQHQQLHQQSAEITPGTARRKVLTFQEPIIIIKKNTNKSIEGSTTIKAAASASATAIAIATKPSTAEEQTAADAVAPSGRTFSRQLSNWSYGSWSAARLNWSFSSARTSFRYRSKSIRKSWSSLQSSKRSKTTWHKPLTNSLFTSHFKELPRRNLDFYVERLIAKGAFGVVFQVRDLTEEKRQEHESKIDKIKNLPTTSKSAAAAAAAASTAAITTEIATTEAAEQQKEETKTSYALKLLKKSKLIEENSIRQIKDEAAIQKACGHHPFIVQQVDLWQNRYNLHILSEYVPNGELLTKISHFSIDLMRLYVAEIALAIDFLHNAGIIYRDAKPENILLTSEFHIKLTDFGLSKWLKLGTTTKTMCGTFKYMGTNVF